VGPAGGGTDRLGDATFRAGGAAGFAGGDAFRDDLAFAAPAGPPTLPDVGVDLAAADFGRDRADFAFRRLVVAGRRAVFRRAAAEV
jgi:hypothetical protein